MDVGAVFRIDRSTVPEWIERKIGKAKIVKLNKRMQKQKKVRIIFPSEKSVDYMFGGNEPCFDKEYVMKLKLARTLLVERVSVEEYERNKGSMVFWMEGAKEVDELTQKNTTFQEKWLQNLPEHRRQFWTTKVKGRWPNKFDHVSPDDDPFSVRNPLGRSATTTTSQLWQHKLDQSKKLKLIAYDR